MTRENAPISNTQMGRISRLIKQLKSPNKNKRYDACEELRVAPHLPEEALKALEQALNDPDRGVAEAAKDAFTFHTHVNVPNKQVAQDNTPRELAYKRKGFGTWSFRVYVLLFIMAFANGLGISIKGEREIWQILFLLGFILAVFGLIFDVEKWLSIFLLTMNVIIAVIYTLLAYFLFSNGITFHIF